MKENGEFMLRLVLCTVYLALSAVTFWISTYDIGEAVVAVLFMVVLPVVLIIWCGILLWEKTQAFLKDLKRPVCSGKDLEGFDHLS